MSFGRTKRERWGRAAVMLLCLLVLVFSFAAKLSLYQPRATQIKALASSKMWQHEAQDAAAVMAAPDESSLSSAGAAFEHVVAPPLAAVMVLMMVSLSAAEWLERETPHALRLRGFVSGSQLRAPPVR